MPGHDIIILGASAGGVEALTTVVRELPAGLPAAVFVVLHIPAHATSVLPAILGRAGTLPAAHAEDGQPIEHGRIYVAPPDMHLVVHSGVVRLSRGPKENSARPAIDALMRTAARAYGPRVVGVVLSGNLDDGTAGLVAIKARGGVAVVQDPDEALFAGMPQSAVDNVDCDWVLPLGRIADRLSELAAAPAADDARPAHNEEDAVDFHDPAIVPPDFATDGTESPHAANGAHRHGGRENPPSAYSCPECHGTLWEVQEAAMIRFQCRVGHRYSVDTLVAEQNVALEAALWTALRSLEESAALSRRLANRATGRGHQGTSARFRQQAIEMARRAQVVRAALHAPADDAQSGAEGNVQASSGASVSTTLT
jgi:two-component system chemotaxis response regulator CheB